MTMQERIKLIKSMWRSGDTAKSIAERTGLTIGQVSGAFYRHAETLSPCHLTKSSNTNEYREAQKEITNGKIDKIKSIWRPGDSAKVLAEKLGWSRQAVTAFFIRNREALQPCTLDGRQNPTKHTKPLREEIPPPETMIGKELVDLDPFDCRFVVGKIFCANPSTKRFGYCKYHHNIVYRRIEK